MATSMMMEDSIKRRTAKRKTSLIFETTQGNTSVPEAMIEGRVDDAMPSMANSLGANSMDDHTQYETQLRDLQEVYRRPCLRRAPENRLLKKN